ncbi:MAG: glutamate--tRNA ligase [Pseudobdellovibrionaceae bacterium]|nr:glutamate--tRNA ligase [Bdellovibrionales bacterium]USN48637.1 MAG: glutamate--tRNA ligase [Pseudobdellovibrionaceae bacterium]
MSNSSTVRVRFAPSPTGYLHVGGARTALYCYLYAKKTGGQFILRIEDTDLERSTDESMRQQMADLNWLGLHWDEGLSFPELEDHGPYGPYRQSRRLDIYAEYAEKLVASGKAYYCFLTDEEIEKQRDQAKAEGRPPQVDSPYRDMSIEEARARMAAGDQAVVRFKVDKVDRQYVLNDLVRGEVTFPSDMVGDFVLLRSTGMPVYNFCCVVDDALMKITHVLRAEEHLSNTVRQMMIYEALGFEKPQFGHMSIILGSDRQKLSKRHGATSVNDYRERGFLPEAFNNFMALLGWSSPEGQEILSMQELQEQFDLDRLHHAPAVFDEDKMKWVNATHLRALDHGELWRRVEPFLNEAGLILPKDPDWQSRALSVFKTAMETLVDAVELFRPVSSQALSFDDSAKETMNWESSKLVVQAWREKVQSFTGDYLSEDDFSRIQDEVKEACGVKGKFLFMPIRVAVIGKPHGAELKILVPLLDKSTLVSRADQALAF